MLQVFFQTFLIAVSNPQTSFGSHIIFYYIGHILSHYHSLFACVGVRVSVFVGVCVCVSVCVCVCVWCVSHINFAIVLL